MTHNTENPVTKKAARAELGWGKTKFSAVCRELGMRGRHVTVSRLRDFVSSNPGFVTNSIYEPKKRAPMLRIERTGKRWRVSLLHHPEVFEEGKELSEALVNIAPKIQSVMAHKC